MVSSFASEPPSQARRWPPVPTAVFASGSGTNLQWVIDAARDQTLWLELRLVVSNRPAAYALERARLAGIPTAVFEFDRRSDDRAAYAAQLANKVRASGARLVLLLGWMHVLAPEFLQAGFEGVLNLHPAYLPEDPRADTVVFPDGYKAPAFRGPHALRDAMAAKMPMTGATLIEITPEVDRGPVLARAVMLLREDESEPAALDRLHAVEQLVVRDGIARWIAQRRDA